MESKTADLIIFGGTYEGRRLAEYLLDTGLIVCVLVATDYARQLLPPKTRHFFVSAGRMDREEMKAYIKEQGDPVVIDATHPYAAEASENIQWACRARGCEYIRVLREPAEKNSSQNMVIVEDISRAVKYLNNTKGNILITTGSKNLKAFQALADYEKRCYVRILPDGNAVEECKSLGFPASHIICMQGPFLTEMNRALLHQVKASYMVTKESGMKGGFEEKIAAAKEASVTAIIIGRPAESHIGYSLSEAIHLLRSRYGISKPQRVKLIGMGMGSISNLTAEGLKSLEECQVVIGAKRLLDGISDFLEERGSQRFACFEKEKIRAYIKSHPEYERIGIVFSGDIGFYSAAKGMASCLDFCQVEPVCGISSAAYFFGRLLRPWEDAVLLSGHGREINMITKIKKHKKVFALLGGEWDVKRLCRELLYYGLDKAAVTVGQALSYPQERILLGTPLELLEEDFENPCVVLVENQEACDNSEFGEIKDEEFIRGKVPMTKCEIRSLCIRKLGLHKDSVLYDVGAGTGAVAVEAARLLEDGLVYAIERNPDGIALIEENKRRFGADNIRIIEGEAPEALDGLPVPTHGFIGGSGGRLKEIIRELRNKNPKIRIVLTAVSLETIGQIGGILKEFKIGQADIVQAGIARSKRMAGYHMMLGENPVYIVSF